MTEYSTEATGRGPYAPHSCAVSETGGARDAAARLVKFLEELDADAVGEEGDEPDYDPLADARLILETLEA